MTHLFLFTLGPVQSFIAQARKAHDLHSGSKILSQLCKVAAGHFISCGGEIIFPDINSDSIPNRFMGKIEGDHDLQKVGRQVENSVHEWWKKQFDEPQHGQETSLAELLTDTAVYSEANRQIEKHLDIQWLFQRLVDDSDETYRAAYKELNKNLNALKNTRPFHTSEETGRKCSLDGERNVIFYRLAQNQVLRTADRAPLYSSENLVINYNDLTQLKLRHLQPGEGLSAVSMLKRFQDFDADDFPDTAQFALSETMHKIGRKYLIDMTKHFGHNDSKHLNWQLFFEENLNERYFVKQGLPLGKRNKAIDIQEELAKKARENGRNLEKYYALVVFDGDHMGEWWKGSRLKPDVKLEDFHNKLKEKLATFAQTVRTEYSKDGHRGWVIYAGGDDFLGFFNLHYLAESLEFLTKKYQEIVHNELESQIEGDHKLTFSAGVCIAHYKEPLSLVLAQARDMEHDAKKLRDEKNALGIAAIPGSGQIAKVVLPFEHFTHLGQVISDLQTPDFSNAFVSKARSELAAFIEKGKDKNGKSFQKIADGLIETAQRLLDRAVSRACNLTKEEGTDEEFQKQKNVKVETLQTAVKTLLETNSQNLPAFFDALDIADFIERQTHIAKPKTQVVEP